MAMWLIESSKQGPHGLTETGAAWVCSNSSVYQLRLLFSCFCRVSNGGSRCVSDSFFLFLGIFSSSWFLICFSSLKMWSFGFSYCIFGFFVCSFVFSCLVISWEPIFSNEIKKKVNVRERESKIQVGRSRSRLNCGQDALYSLRHLFPLKTKKCIFWDYNGITSLPSCLMLCKSIHIPLLYLQFMASLFVSCCYICISILIYVISCLYFYRFSHLLLCLSAQDFFILIICVQFQIFFYALQYCNDILRISLNNVNSSYPLFLNVYNCLFTSMKVSESLLFWIVWANAPLTFNCKTSYIFGY